MDDLSSYGGTFMLTAEKLIDKGACEVYLVVAHAEEAILKGAIPDSPFIKKVYTTNSIIRKDLETDKIIIKEII